MVLMSLKNKKKWPLCFTLYPGNIATAPLQFVQTVDVIIPIYYYSHAKPLIYSLRNQDVIEAIKLTEKKVFLI